MLPSGNARGESKPGFDCRQQAEIVSCEDYILIYFFFVLFADEFIFFVSVLLDAAACP